MPGCIASQPTHVISFCCSGTPADAQLFVAGFCIRSIRLQSQIVLTSRSYHPSPRQRVKHNHDSNARLKHHPINFRRQDMPIEPIRFEILLPARMTIANMLPIRTRFLHDLSPGSKPFLLVDRLHCFLLWFCFRHSECLEFLTADIDRGRFALNGR